MAVQRSEEERRREPLTRERVLSAAIELADAGGLESLSMRRLAQQLGVEAMSLYHHVANKEEILSGIADMVVGEYETPEPGRDWKASIRASAVSAYRVLLRHPWAASLLLAGTTPSVARLAYMDALLGSLRGAGFSAEMTDHAYHALDSHIMGFALWVTGMNLPSGEAFDELAAGFLARLPREEMPHLVEHVHQHLKPRDPNAKPEFEFGLDLLLDGLERILSESSAGDG
jgi:AcrR family transcriptional regulator